MKSFWQGRRVFVTGANGFLAGWMVRELLNRGAYVVALNFARNPVSVFERENLDRKTKTITDSVLNFDLLKDIIEKFRVETVFHLGAQAICSIAEDNPLATLDINIKGTYHILEAARQVSKGTQVIVASSDKAYGIHEKLPYEEHFPLKGEFPYEVSKTCADMISTMYWRSFRLPVSIVRCGNLYGGGDGHFSRVIPATIRLLYLNKQPLLIKNGTRDFLYVDDAVQGYLLLAQKMADKKSAVVGEAFNLGTETPRSIVETITIITNLMRKHHLKPKETRFKRLGIPHQYLSFQKARKLLGWEPKIRFEDGLQQTIDWYCDYFDRVGPSLITQSSLTNYSPNVSL